MIVTSDKLQDAKAKPTQRCFAARWILPIARPPIQGGWLRVQGDRIVEVRSDAPPAEAENLGDVAILPRGVNAHTHLEFSDCQQPIGQVGTSLSDWIGQVVAGGTGKTRRDQEQAIRRGLEESRQAGVCLIGEIATPPCDYPAEVACPEVYTFAEVLGLHKIAAMNESPPRLRKLPHAPTRASVRMPPIRPLARRFSRAWNWRSEANA